MILQDSDGLLEDLDDDAEALLGEKPTMPMSESVST